MRFFRLYLLCLFSLALVGCSSGGGGSTTPSTEPNRLVQAPAQVSSRTASLNLLFDLTGEVRARISEQATSFAIEVYSGSGVLERELSVARTSRVQVENLPPGRVLVRVRFLQSDGSALGYWEKFAELGEGAYTLSFTTLLPGTPPSGLPSFPLDGDRPTTLGVFEQPARITIGQPFSLTFALTGASGDILTRSGGSVLLSSSDGDLSGRTSTTLQNGLARFDNLTVTGDGPFTFTASTSVGGTVLTGRTFPVSREPDPSPPGLGVPARLRFLQEPSNLVARRLFSPSPQVRIEDVYGNLVQAPAFNVSLSLERVEPQQVAGELEGELSVGSTAGTALFRTVSATSPGTYRLVASASGLLSARSSSLSILPETLGGGSGLSFASPLVLSKSQASTYPKSVAADLDGDGHLDLVQGSAPAYPQTTLSVLFGDGTGLLERVLVPQGSLSWNVETAANLNDDTLPELLGIGPNGVVVMVENRGGRDFAPPTTITTGSEPTDLVVGLFDSDANPDIAVVQRGNDSIGLFEVSTSLTTSAIQTVNLPANSRPYRAVATHLDDDSDLDLAVVIERGQQIVLLENVNGELQLPAPGSARFLEVGGVPSDLVAGDLDGDGRDDLVVSRPMESDLRVFLSNGAFSFEQPVSLAVSGQPEQVTAADVDGDGRTDLVAAGPEGETVTIWRNFGPLSSWKESAVKAGPRPLWLSSGDFNEDGALDFVVSKVEQRILEVLLNRGDGSFATPETQEHRFEGYPYVLVGRFDGSPGRDVALLIDLDGVVVYPDGDVLTGRGTESAIPTLSGFWTRVMDVNGDDFDDLVEINPGNTEERLATYLNQGDGRFVAAFTTKPSFQTDEFVAVGDLNSDGLDDFVATVLFDQAQLQVVLSNGDGSFSEMPPLTIDPTWNRWPKLADLDGDENLDIVYSNGEVYWLRGSGDGTFESPAALGIPGEVMAVVDADGDGYPEVVQGIPGGVRVFENLGNASFGPAVESGTSETLSAAFVLFPVDVDGDGDLDLVGRVDGTGDFFSNFGFTVYENLGALIYSKPRSFLGTQLSYSSEPPFVDFDGDGDLDFVSAESEYFLINRNLGPGLGSP